ncbi:MAG: hypothetical protein COB78_10065 [Hyphomicrobiales bacterium]|nr:MAG: hypothetical protein COB78_10065 [Hyphomicrobiales bacterium]
MGQSIVIHGLIKKRAEVAGLHRVAVKAAESIKDDLAAIDRALRLCGYKEDPKAIAPRGKYRQMFGRNELKLAILDTLRKAPADDLTVADAIIEAKGWRQDEALHADVLKRVRHAIQRARNSGLIVQDFGPDGCLWKLAQC